MAESAQSAEEVEVPEEEEQYSLREQAFAGLPQSTPVKSRFGHDQLKMVLTSPAETNARTKPSTSGTYLALPPTWRTSQVSIFLKYTCLIKKLTYSHSQSIV